MRRAYALWAGRSAGDRHHALTGVGADQHHDFRANTGDFNALLKRLAVAQKDHSSSSSGTRPPWPLSKATSDSAGLRGVWTADSSEEESSDNDSDPGAGLTGSNAVSPASRAARFRAHGMWPRRTVQARRVRSKKTDEVENREQVKQRMSYRRIFHAKDTKNYAAADMAAIFGRKADEVAPKPAATPPADTSPETRGMSKEAKKAAKKERHEKRVEAELEQQAVETAMAEYKADAKGEVAQKQKPITLGITFGGVLFEGAPLQSATLRRMFVSAATIEKQRQEALEAEGGKGSVNLKGGFTEDDQANLFNQAHEAKITGKKGLGFNSVASIRDNSKALEYSGQKQKFDGSDNEEEAEPVPVPKNDRRSKMAALFEEQSKRMPHSPRLRERKLKELSDAQKSPSGQEEQDQLEKARRKDERRRAKEAEAEAEAAQSEKARRKDERRRAKEAEAEAEAAKPKDKKRRAKESVDTEEHEEGGEAQKPKRSSRR